jgi:hypothetical protein
VVEEIVQFLEHFDAWFIRIFELGMLVLWDLLELVVNIIKEVRKTACFSSKRLVFAWAVATFELLASMVAYS